MTITSTVRFESATTCPQCHTEIPAIPGYSPWCHDCGWNLDPAAEAPTPLSSVEILLKKLGDGASSSLQRDVLIPRNLKPRLTLSKIAAYALSIGVFGLALALLVAGVLLVLTGRFFPMIVGVALVGLAWLARPRFDRVPDDAVAAHELPRLRAVVNRIAQVVGTKPPDLIRIDPSFNASVQNTGWRQVRVLTIGLPFFAVLTPQEQVAILAHEFGHFTNGDPRRGLVLGSAFESLVRWHLAIRPRSLAGVEDERLPGLLALPINIVMGLISLVPLSLAYALVALISRESQRGEYLADAQAARLAGSPAALSALDKLHLQPLVQQIASASTADGWTNQNLWDELGRQATQFPEREFERFRRIDRGTSARINLTHPPTASRLEVIATRPVTQPALVLDHVEAEAMQEELRRQMPPIQEDLLDDYRHSLLSIDTAVGGDFATFDYDRPNQDWLM